MNKWEVFKFVARRVPLIVFCGVRFISLDKNVCTVSLRRNWRNRNPYNAAYFASVMAAGEMAAGIPLFDAMRKAGNVVAVIVEAQATFYRPVIKDTLFRFITHDVQDAVNQAVAENKSEITTVIYGYADNMKTARVQIRWRLRRMNEHRR